MRECVTTPMRGALVSGLGSGQAAHLQNPSGINGLGKSLGDVHRRALANGRDHMRTCYITDAKAASLSLRLKPLAAMG